MVIFKRCVILVLIFALLVTMISSYTYAKGPKDFPGTIGSASGAKEPISNIIGGILGVIRTVGVVIAVVILVVIACKYMLAAPGDRADLKKYLQIYIIGALVFFGAAGLVDLVRNLTNDATGG